MKKVFPSDEKYSIIKNTKSGSKMGGSSFKTWIQRACFVIKRGIQSLLCNIKIFTLFLGGKLKAFFIRFCSLIKKYAVIVFDYLKDKLPVIFNKIKTFFSFIWKYLKIGFIAIGSFLQKGVVTLGQTFKAVFSFIGRVTKKVCSSIKKFFVAIPVKFAEMKEGFAAKKQAFATKKEAFSDKVHAFVVKKQEKAEVRRQTALVKKQAADVKKAEKEELRKAVIAEKAEIAAQKEAALNAQRAEKAAEREAALVAKQAELKVQREAAAKERAEKVAEREAALVAKQAELKVQREAAAVERVEKAAQREAAAIARQAEKDARREAVAAKRAEKAALKVAADRVSEEKITVNIAPVYEKAEKNHKESAVKHGFSRVINSIGNFFHNIKIGIDNGFRAVMTSKVLKVVSLSITGFFVGITITGLVLVSTDKEESQTGVGGLETAGVPEFNENLEALLKEDEFEINSSFLNEDVVTYESVEEDIEEPEDDSSLTYETYRVRTGDMISVIADKYGVTQDTIISVNNIKQSRLIQPGQYLKIPSMPGIIYTVKKNGETPESIAKKYDINAEKCALVNYMDTDTSLNAGSSLFLPDAELDWATRQEINGDLFKCPLHCRYWLSSPYGWRNSPFNPGKRSFHGGIDMACGTGNNIYPAMDGVVIEASYNNIYGNYVIIQHHSGYKTLYGHLSRIMCRAGNFVYTTTCIGKVGSTGMSTGPHLHFTVYKYGKTVNPSLLLN